MEGVGTVVLGTSTSDPVLGMEGVGVVVLGTSTSVPWLGMEGVGVVVLGTSTSVPWLGVEGDGVCDVPLTISCPKLTSAADVTSAPDFMFDLFAAGPEAEGTLVADSAAVAEPILADECSGVEPSEVSEVTASSPVPFGLGTLLAWETPPPFPPMALPSSSTMPESDSMLPDF